MTSFADQIDNQAEKYLNDYADNLRNDKPTIEVAIKNLMAVLLSKCLQPHDFKSSSFNDIDNDEVNLIFEPTVVIKCAKLIVKAINEVELLPPLEWSESIPQEENQTADSRLDQIAQYKVAYHLYNSIKNFNDNNNENPGKIYKLFGKIFFKWTNSWNNIRNKVLAMNNGDIDNLILTFFLDSFGYSINCNHNTTNDSNDYLRNDQELIWCTNFNELLIQRQEKRRDAAQQRLLEQQERLLDFQEKEEQEVER